MEKRDKLDRNTNKKIDKNKKEFEKQRDKVVNKTLDDMMKKYGFKKVN
jgi:hypothetical protein